MRSIFSLAFAASLTVAVVNTWNRAPMPTRMVITSSITPLDMIKKTRSLPVDLTTEAF
jgi:hypothetical protein